MTDGCLTHSEGAADLYNAVGEESNELVPAAAATTSPPAESAREKLVRFWVKMHLEMAEF